LPRTNKVVAANDLFSERNLEDAVKITIMSWPVFLAIEKNKTPLFSKNIKFLINGEVKGVIEQFPETISPLTLPSVFFGRGRGFHGINYFTGIPLRLLLAKFISPIQGNLKTGYLAVVGDDGFRAVYSGSEIFNRNDCQEIILCDGGNKEGGRFSLFSGPDFFSDRAVKAIKEIYIID